MAPFKITILQAPNRYENNQSINILPYALIVFKFTVPKFKIERKINLYIREVKRKIYDEIVRQISKNGKSEPHSRIYSLELSFNHDNYILKIFADTSNKLVALEAFKYYYDTDLHRHEYAEVRKNSVLSAMIEILLNQYLTAI